MMKARKRWLIVITSAFLFVALVALPRIIEAARANWTRVEKRPGAAPVIPIPPGQKNDVVVGMSVKNDTSPPLREMKQEKLFKKAEKEANENPKIPASLKHKDAADPVVQEFSFMQSVMSVAMPSALLNFDGIPFPGVGCNCAPPDTNGEVGATQYVQIVNEGYQVFNKTTGASQLGPAGIATLWGGFGGVCQSNGNGDPVVMYDQIANR